MGCVVIMSSAMIVCVCVCRMLYEEGSWTKMKGEWKRNQEEEERRGRRGGGGGGGLGYIGFGNGQRPF